MASQHAPVDVHAAVGVSSPAPGASGGGSSSSVTPPVHAGSHIASNPALMSPTVITTSAAGGIGSATASGATSNNAVYPAAALSALEAYKKKDNSKIVVRFKAIGNAPIMKNNYFRITAFNRFQAVIQFLRKELGWKASDALFLYINSSFSPAPDDTVGNLFRCFGTEGHLIVNYSTQAAWG